MKRLNIGLRVTVIVFILSGCAATRGRTTLEKRQAILSMRNEVLADLYQVRPPAKARIEAAPGYAVFSNASVNVIFASFGGGYGVVTGKKIDKPIFMRMAEVGIGLGLGAKDFRAVFIFHDHKALTRFIDYGWEVGGHADAAAKAGDKGAAASGEVLLEGMTIYQLTKTGLALQVTVKANRYWKDADLN